MLLISFIKQRKIYLLSTLCAFYVYRIELLVKKKTFMKNVLIISLTYFVSTWGIVFFFIATRPNIMPKTIKAMPKSDTILR